MAKNSGYKKNILDLLRQLWEMHPEERLGQLLENYVFDEKSMVFQDDEETKNKIKKEIGIFKN